jgi:hypothetical protein
MGQHGAVRKRGADMFAMDYALVIDKVNRSRAENENERRASLSKAEKPSRFERAIRWIGNGLLRVVEKADLQGRPRPSF